MNFSDLRFDEDWIAALAKIIVFAAGKTDADENDNQELQDVLSRFQLRLPNRATLKPLREIASDMADVVMLNIIDEGINGINLNNRELSQLAKRLGFQIKQANVDANTLKKITGKIEKVTKVVKAAKALEENLANKDLSKIEKLQAIITSLEGLETIFNPA